MEEIAAVARRQVSQRQVMQKLGRGLDSNLFESYKS